MMSDARCKIRNQKWEETRVGTRNQTWRKTPELEPGPETRTASSGYVESSQAGASTRTASSGYVESSQGWSQHRNGLLGLRRELPGWSQHQTASSSYVESSKGWTVATVLLQQYCTVLHIQYPGLPIFKKSLGILKIYSIFKTYFGDPHSSVLEAFFR